MNNNFNYKEKREKVVKDTIGCLSSIEPYDSWSTFTIDMNNVNSLLDSLKTRRPVTDYHIYFKKDLESKFKNKKQYDKFMTVVQCLKDFDLKEDLINTRKIKNFFSMEFADCIKVLEKLAESNISAHNFLSNMPQTLSYPNEWAKFVVKILGYSIDQNTLFKLLLVSNFKRILEAPNKDELLNQLAYLETKQKLSLSGDTTAEPEMLIKDLNLPFCRFSKSASDITSIGNKTFCCFKKDGVGEPLMLIALKSPIAGIIMGEKGNKTWFAYVWELLEYNEDTKTFDINLVLDNIEANNRLDITEYYYIIDNIVETNLYKNIYLGYCRNDIDVPTNIISEKQLKSRGITFFDKETKKYERYDDSKYIHTCYTREDDDEYTRHPINNGNFHRIKYVIDFLKDHKEESIPGLFYEWNTENAFYKNNITRKFDISTQLDLEKSYVEMSNTSLKAFILYNLDGEILLRYEQSIL